MPLGQPGAARRMKFHDYKKMADQPAGPLDGMTKHNPFVTQRGIQSIEREVEKLPPCNRPGEIVYGD